MINQKKHCCCCCYNHHHRHCYYYYYHVSTIITPCKAVLQCFDAVGWAAGRASGL